MIIIPLQNCHAVFCGICELDIMLSVSPTILLEIVLFIVQDAVTGLRLSLLAVYHLAAGGSARVLALLINVRAFAV